MSEFITEHWVEVALAVITAGAIGFCKVLLKQIKNYKKLLDQQDQSEISNLIQEQLKPVVEDIQHLTETVEAIQQAHKAQMDSIVRSYRFRLVQLCKIYLDQGYITTAQFEQLSEFYKLYHDLGGNGQAQEYYEKAIALPVKD